MDGESESCHFSVDCSKTEPMDCGNDPNQTPPWFDPDKFDCGRRFYRRHFFGCATAALGGLLLLLSVPEILDTLVFTGRSHVKWKAFRRYLGTLRHVDSWYEGDVWRDGDAARDSLLRVRRVHSRLDRRLRRRPLADNAAADAPLATPPPPSQYSMAVTQFAFVGLVVLFPHRFGIHPSSSSQLEGFVHFWRCIGYLLGIADRHNVCRETYDDTVRTCRRLLREVFWARLADPPPGFRPMAQALVDGVRVFVPFLNLDAFLARTYDVIGHRDPESERRPLRGRSWVIYRVTTFVFDRLLVQFPFLHAIYNIFLRFSLALAQVTWIKKWGLPTQRRRVSSFYRWQRTTVSAHPI